MNIRARISLLFVALLMSGFSAGAAPVRADELPVDKNWIETLTPEQARKLAKEFPGVEVVVTFKGFTVPFPNCLPLNGLKSLDAETAAALAGYGKGPLFLNGLTTLDADTAKALAEFKGEHLFLDGLTTLNADTAKALAEFKGSLRLGDSVYASFREKNPLTPENASTWAAFLKGDLSSVTAFDSPDSVAIAKALATFKGPLALRNLKKISPKTLTALIEKQDVVIPPLESLELIQEPNGSITEDFIIPEHFQERQQSLRHFQHLPRPVVPR